MTGRRARDHPQDLGGGGLLLEGLAQLAGALLDLALEARVGLLEVARHAVELLGQAFQLVAGAHHDAIAQVTLAELGRPRLEGPDRPHHPAGQDQADDHRQDDANQLEQGGAADRGLQGGEGLLERLLDEDRPPQRGDRHVRGQDPLVPQVARDDDRVRRRPRRPRGGQGGLDVLEPAEVGLLEHQADVGVGDQRALPFHHEGQPGLAHPDLGHHVPDELEVHLHRGDAPLLPLGDGDGHVGLGLLAEIHGPAVEPAGAGLRKPGVGREVGIAAEHVHGEPRDAHLLPPGGIDVADLGDGGHLPLQAVEVEAPLLEWSGRHRTRLGHPAHLALDLGDEALDPDRRGLRLLPLEGREHLLALLIREVDLDEAAGEQGDGDEEGEEDDVLPEQPPAPCHRPGEFRPGAKPLSKTGAGPARPAPAQAGTPSTGRGRSGQPGPMAAFFFSMMSAAYFSR
jgi:hypothetical protein